MFPLFPKKFTAKGSMLLFVMVFGAIAFTTVVLTVAGYAVTEMQASRSKQNREGALEVADAGISYYRWHLAHSSTDYRDGNPTSTPSPYVHDYKDKDGNVIGHFALTITPPPIGSTVVTIQSQGWLDIQPNSKRTIKARVGFPSLADYSFLTNGAIWIGNTESTHGKFHSNGGVRYDGTNDAQVTSAVATYTCPTWQSCSGIKPGVWGAGGPTNLWVFPVPAKDFAAVTAKLAEIKAGALADGGGNWPYLSSSGQKGWRLQFMNNGTVAVSKVLTCNNYSGQDTNGQNNTWCIDAASYGTVTTYNIPTSSYIYVDDMVWVDGVVNGKATVGAGTGKSIIINGNLTYLAKDGTSVLGLIAEQNVLVPRNSPTNLEIDAAMIAQNGAVERYYYPGNIKNSILVYGAIITNQTWTWSWNDPVTSGYINTNSTYDANLTYGPPPGFPVGSSYNLISWEEVRN